MDGRRRTGFYQFFVHSYVKKEGREEGGTDPLKQTSDAIFWVPGGKKGGGGGGEVGKKDRGGGLK